MNPVVKAITSRVTLGVCAVILAAAAVWATLGGAREDQIQTQATEQECRDAIDATLAVEVAKSLFRIESGLRELAKGDEQALANAVHVSEDEADAYADAIDAKANAVETCQ